jgi:hypothetical protein
MGADSAGISLTEAPEYGAAVTISFHGGIGGPQTRPFILHPVELPYPESPVDRSGDRPDPAAVAVGAE